ncbi:hypothetical protein MB14_08745 [Roseivirga ehrenbergii]|uniref:Uncharacterized protein n=1 Tax=Roseivirga ehrenbergii (strain DSM 102268 / JCM 13514 / KCTC 12282 / NCIMB 14502 / KMM 6017) TaxID=279360 RepID=A0A150X088_ROSEK|nr:hypothetical protein MB14_08745 [Roseivirga ehrenbergii]
MTFLFELYIKRLLGKYRYRRKSLLWHLSRGVNCGKPLKRLMETLCSIAHGLNRGLFECITLGNGFNHFNWVVGLLILPQRALSSAKGKLVQRQ